MTKIDIFPPNKPFMRKDNAQSSSERTMIRQPDLTHLYADQTGESKAAKYDANFGADFETDPQDDMDAANDRDDFPIGGDKLRDDYAIFSCFAKMAVSLGWLQPNGLATGEKLIGLANALAQQSEESLINSTLSSKDENLQFLVLEILLSWGTEREMLFANLRHHAHIRDLISEAVSGFLTLAGHENEVADLFALFGAQLDAPGTVPQFIALRMIDALCGWDDFAHAFQHAIKIIPMPIYRIVVELSEQDRKICRRHIADVVAALHKAAVV